ncbi:MAG: bifunctional methylenetetrahydrofolate dehydrogenase/methenyltetrahydrofolate cyclohydrolase FolD [Geminicoccaceae bacterium]
MLRAQTIDGKAAAARLRDVVRTEANAFEALHGSVPKLCVLIVGDDPASRTYVRTKTRMAAEAGIASALIELPAECSTAQLLTEIMGLNRDPHIHGILVQLPLPPQIDAQAVLEAIDPRKDVDGFHPLNVGRLFSAGRHLREDLLIPCTPYGCLHLLQMTLGADGLAGREAVVIGRSNIVGKPMAALLLAADCTVTLAHSYTHNLPAVCRRADILIAAVGKPRMVTAEWVKHGATVIDVGINRIIDSAGVSRIVGDVDYDTVAEVASAITPVPGGVGPMTVASLLRNTLIAATGQGTRIRTEL